MQAMEKAASPASGKAAFSPVSLKSAASPASRKSLSPASLYERLGANIGEGTYGKVHKARDLKTGRLVAIKKAKASAANRDVGGISFTVLREIKLMQAVKHPNVMGCLDVFADGGVIHIVMEFMDEDLNKLIERKGLALEEAHVKCLAQQVLEGLAALHGQFFVHRDVTPTNVLLSFSSGIAKLADFGVARTLGHRDRPLTPMCTTLWYRAPELLYGAKFYGQMVDMWSTGCVVAEMFLRQALFPGRGEFDMFNRIFEKCGTPQEEVWRDVSGLPHFVEFSAHPRLPMSAVVPSASASAHALLDSLLALDPKQRPAARDALAHEFFNTAWPAACRPQDLPFVSSPRACAGS